MKSSHGPKMPGSPSATGKAPVTIPGTPDPRVRSGPESGLLPKITPASPPKNQ